MSFTVNRKNIDKYAADLLAFNRKLARQISSKSLNRVAAGAALFAKRNVKKQFTLRNKFELGSIRSTRTPAGRPVDRQFVFAGSVSPRMALQEKGGALPLTGKGRRLTTARGSREGATAFPRRKLATGRLKSKNIKLGKRRKAKGTPGARAKGAVEAARRSRTRFIYLELGRDKSGIFEVKKKSIRMVHWITRRRLSVRPRPWFKPAVDKARKAAPGIYVQEFRRGVTRSTLFKS